MKMDIKLIQNTVSTDIKNIRNVIGPSGKKQLLLTLARKFVQMAKSTFGVGQTTFRGNTWNPYSARYAKRIGSSIPTLLRSGKLKNSIRMTNVYGESISIYSDTPYSAVQFFGGGNNIPSRKFFPMQGQGNTWKLTLTAANALDVEAIRLMSILSSGRLPKTVSATRREYTYGNPLQSGRS